MNTLFLFYLTGFAYGQLEKVVFQCVLEGVPFEKKHDAQEWISDNISELMDKADLSLVCDHVVVGYEPDARQPFEVEVVNRHTGEFHFSDEKLKVVKKSKPRTASVDKLAKQVDELKDKLSQFEYDRLTESLANLKKQTVLLKELTSSIKETLDLKAKLKTKAEKVEINKNHREFPSYWIEPNGTFHEVGFACHNEWAYEWLTTNGHEGEDLRYGTSTDKLVCDEGWLRILGWCDPPAFDWPPRLTPKQRQAVKSYCQDNTCELPKEVDIR